MADNYTISPSIVNTVGLGYSSTQCTQVPTNQISSAVVYGFNTDGAAFSSIGSSGSHGVGENSNGTTAYFYQNYYGYRFQDTVAWQRGDQAFRFGGQVFFQGLDSSYGGTIHNYSFSNVTGGRTNTSLMPT